MYDPTAAISDRHHLRDASRIGGGCSYEPECTFCNPYNNRNPDPCQTSFFFMPAFLWKHPKRADWLHPLEITECPPCHAYGGYPGRNRKTALFRQKASRYPCERAVCQPCFATAFHIKAPLYRRLSGSNPSSLFCFPGGPDGCLAGNRRKRHDGCF